jgi:hypothetical protein
MEMLLFNSEFISLKRHSSSDFLKKGCYLWAFHHHKIPHLGLSVNGHYFSVTFNKKQVNESVETPWRLSQSKAIPCFFIQLIDTIECAVDIKYFFESHSFLQNTCLLPILQSLGLAHKNIDILPDLLHYLNANKMIKSWHCNHLYQKERLSLLHYTKHEVMEMVEKGMTK